MSYIKVEIGGVDRGFKYDNKSTGEILKHLNVSLQGLGKEMVDNPFLTYPAILFFGAKRSAEKSKESFNHELDDVFDWVDDEPEGLLGEKVISIATCFSETIMTLLPKSLQEEVPNEEKVKKSSTGKKT